MPPTAHIYQIAPPQSLLTPPQAAEYLGVDQQTLANWRMTGRHGLPFVRIGRLIRYKLADLVAWIDANRVGVEA